MLDCATEASAATAIATVAAITRNASLVAEAQSALEQAELLTSQVLAHMISLWHLMQPL